MTQRSIDLHELSDRVRLFGEYDRNLSAIESSLDVAVHADGDRLLLAGDDAAVARAERVVKRVLDAAVGGAHITPDDVKLALTDSASPSESGALTHTLMRTHRGREVRPRTPGQREFIHAIERFTLTFGIGPAGTGKTYLAIVMAVRALKRREATRIVLSRPAVEAGERLGFLPGDLREKVDPYMRPLFDALGDLLDDSTVNKYMERGTLEVAPLAYMRGRTLSDAFVILDEAQNATDDQLKMFLTRLGSGSKMVVTGDVTQIDLPGGQRSGLRAAATRLREIDDIGVVEMDESESCAIRWWRRSSGRTHPRCPVIYYRNDVRRSGVDGRALVATAKRLLAAIGETESAISLSLIGDIPMRELNRDYRGKDAATDVLSFPMEQGPPPDAERLLGDVVISVYTAARQATEYDATLQRELYRLLIHGLLHLLGHDHVRAAERRVMEREERRLAAAIALPWPYDAVKR